MKNAVCARLSRFTNEPIRRSSIFPRQIGKTFGRNDSIIQLSQSMCTRNARIKQPVCTDADRTRTEFGIGDRGISFWRAISFRRGIVTIVHARDICGKLRPNIVRCSDNCLSNLRELPRNGFDDRRMKAVPRMTSDNCTKSKSSGLIGNIVGSISS